MTVNTYFCSEGHAAKFASQAYEISAYCDACHEYDGFTLD